MACSIKFVRLDDFIADIDELDLSANGYSLAEDGYFPVVAPIGARTVSESITLKLKGTSKDDLAAMTQELNEIVKQVQWWIDNPGVERYQVWIRVQQENETYPRQAQIVNILPPDRVEIFKPEEWRDNYIGNYTFGIERTAFWEDPYTYPTATVESGVNSIGGLAQMNQTINGDVPARLARLLAEPKTVNTPPNAGADEYYIGFRTSRFGNPANFAPVWNCKDAYLRVADTTTTADSSAYSGTRVQCDFSVIPTLNQRTNWFLSTVTANAADQRGTFTVLLRAMMSDTSSVARVRLGYSMSYPGTSASLLSPVYRSRVIVNGFYYGSGTGWGTFELGSLTIPPQRVKSGLRLDTFAVSVAAERLSGAGSLYLDCLILVPTAEGFIHMKDTSAFGGVSTGTGTAGEGMGFYQYADDTYSAYSTAVIDISNNVGAVAPVQSTALNLGLPANGEAPYIVVVQNRWNAVNSNTETIYQSVKGDTADIYYDYIPRFRTLRGNVT